MKRTTLPLHRRTRVERRVLAFIRGEWSSHPDPRAVRCFAILHRLAERRGLGIQPPGTSYVSEGELALLSWIASSQRTSATRQPANDWRLAVVTARCGQWLNRMRLRLSPLTLHSGPDGTVASGR
ncbi:MULTISPECIES: hypothetical protein [Sphingobium]|jgi:hypothetical protein|uniref:hypothetical protein n=1 Tax=Sphingobium TaxID=165695 RepID=UPI000DBB0FE8|nr:MULTISPECIES: hypothetical protein [Sphingobium]BBD03104.1 hypothetical protein YGS_C2P1118 [Sphingobium sp. YG1]